MGARQPESPDHQKVSYNHEPKYIQNKKSKTMCLGAGTFLTGGLPRVATE
jgi:hypothetical protein